MTYKKASTVRPPLRLLLSDGSGLTSRQVAAQAAAAGHEVEALSASRLCLCAFTRSVRRIHAVPALGRDPEGWLGATLEVLERRRPDVLLGTQEQVAILSREVKRVHETGVAVAAPPFESLLRVQDKVSQARTLEELGLPHPRTRVIASAQELLSQVEPPAYLKAPVGTASAAVHLVTDRDALHRAAHALDFADGIVAQDPAAGPLAMVQAVFADGRLVAWHANLREREGGSGGAAVKRSIAPPRVAGHLRSLGAALRWHGALSLDVILTSSGPVYIDINPRLVEPGNAWHAGLDLVEAMIAVSLGEKPETLAPGCPDRRTHQLLIALLGAAQRKGSRRAVAAELLRAVGRAGPYTGSVEELTPMAGDPIAAAPVLAAALSTLAYPPAWRWFSAGAVSQYALTPAAWRRITGEDEPRGAQNG